MIIKSVEISNFTVFKKIDIEFNKGINVIIGDNGTGKTHLMKLLYATQKEEIITENSEYFKGLVTRRMCSSEDENCENHSIDIKSDMSSGAGDIIFIPAKDMLTHSKSFLSLYEKFDMPFDKTHKDIISKSLLPNLRQIPEIGQNILSRIENIIGGKVVVENETFYIKKENGLKVEFSVEAEGIKKIAILWQLIMNESITENSILFWDEPEANINPSLMKTVVEILLELSRQGVQIFLSTHNYIFAKYMEILSKESDSISFHSLYKSEDGSALCETKRKLIYLENNSILKENIQIYETEIERVME